VIDANVIFTFKTDLAGVVAKLPFAAQDVVAVDWGDCTVSNSCNSDDPSDNCEPFNYAQAELDVINDYALSKAKCYHLGSPHDPPIMQWAKAGDYPVWSHTYAAAGTWSVKIQTTTGQLVKFDFGANDYPKTCDGNILIPPTEVRNFVTSIDKFEADLSGLTELKYAALGYLPKLESIPANIFYTGINLTSMTGIFISDYALKQIPPDLFKYNTKVTNFLNSFINCKSITSIPLDLFRYNINATTFKQAFSGTSIKEIPADMFKYNTKVTDFHAAFSGTKITTIPEGLFDNNPLMTYASEIFSWTSLLTTVPKNLFANNRQIKSFGRAFEGCSNITSELPNVWDSSYWTPSYAIPYPLYLIGDYTGTNYGEHKPFKGCTNAANYSSVPTSWK
jgi:hypothetical protein